MNPGPHHISEFLCLLCAVISLNKLRNSFLISFFPFLLPLLVVELYNNYAYYTLHQSTVHIFNVLVLYMVAFYSYIFYRLSQSPAYRRIILFLSLAFMVVYILYFTFFGDIHEFSSSFVAVSSMIQLLLSCLFLYQYLQFDSYVNEPELRFGLWLAGGLLIFNSGVAISFSLYDYLRTNKVTVFGMPMYNFVPRYLSLVLYGCIGTGFLTWKKRTTILFQQ